MSTAADRAELVREAVFHREILEHGYDRFEDGNDGELLTEQSCEMHGGLRRPENQHLGRFAAGIHTRVAEAIDDDGIGALLLGLDDLRDRVR